MYMESRKNGADEPIWRAEVETQTYRRDMWTQQEKEGVGQIGRVALTYVHYDVWNQ